ncbi:conserved Plasmodium protein, unknown function [Plasmodium berghei]|uniref:Uncharacterized protein n=2 Tax=Plasmodium berghei TaxID=5821 RepID=A0A509ANV2_PLABA|nr:conserved Plasmodium protein, unknown function [Plasmodium berghei ANKA]CXI61138.1 conserved Plasmodium protein, unknown function [Plasmodium berghei]SCM23621.1 conserved Plasmodium protein, unknown function [Plasmodium berghei]SCN26689.1 conserved Plasmodium protein, unknown function [Plasmodium berghei]SCO60974.1 conserved Plasmodium protein, unknown function [Plasmodium berghei]SCO63050.1 conserved Plasmodium protein, unknown function [Plasmodium berghei]|eukprot:XP_034422305.1 conserved Plasmodium protein, unknown function [Plasmodium berghei ANKA]
MEDTMTNISEENLNYIKTCIGYSLAKSTLYAIKTDTEDPLNVISQQLKNFTTFNEDKKKKKKKFIKKINSYHIKIHDEINKNFTKNSIKDLYEFGDKNDGTLFEKLDSLLNIIKNVLDAENVYIGKMHTEIENEKKTGKKKKKTHKKNILKFLFTSDKCNIKNEIVLNEIQFESIFKQFAETKKDNFFFEKNYIFPNIIKENYTYDELSENLFPNIKRFYENKNRLKIINKSDFKQTANESHKVENDDISEFSNDNVPNSDYSNELSSSKNTEYESLHEEESINETSDEEDEAEGNEKDLLEKENEIIKEYENFDEKLINTLNMNLTYKCTYIYEIMEIEQSFLYQYMVPGDFLAIPLIYYSCYNLNFLNYLYNMKNQPEQPASNSLETIACMAQEDDGGKMVNPEVKGKKKTNWIIDLKKEKKIEMCLCIDNRGSVNKINEQKICALIHFSYLLIIRMLMCERKSVEYMIECEHGSERQLIDKLQTKVQENNQENIINKFKNKLAEHHYFIESSNLINYMASFQWIEKKILKYQHKIIQINKIKVEFNKNLLQTLLNCFIIIDHEYSKPSLSKKIIQNYEWNELILYINQNFIDRLTMFNPLLEFEEKEIEKLHEIKNLLNIAPLKKNNYLKNMEGITTYGITLLEYFNNITINILDEVLKIKEGKLISNT